MKLTQVLWIALIATWPAVQASAQQPPEPPAVKADGTVPTVTLIANGEAPRRELRLTPEVGLKQSIEMLMSQQMTMTMNGAPMPMPAMPGMRMIMEVVVSEVAENGDITTDMETTAFEAVGQPPPGVGPLLKQMEGMTVQMVMDNRGVTKSSQLTPPPGMHPAMQQQLQSVQQNLGQMSAPFPTEPVGVGAEWKVDQTISVSGLKVDQTGRYKLIKIDGDVIELEVQVVAHADEQDFQPPGMPPNATAHVKSMDSEGTGHMVVRLNRITVDEATMDVQMDMEMTISMDQMQMDMQQEMEMTTKMKSEVVKDD